MTKERVARINELARKKKTVGLTAAELQEQAELRAEYLRDFREGFRRAVGQLLGMHADGGIDEGEALGQRERGAAAAQITAGIEDPVHALGVNGFEQSEAIRVKRAVIIVGVGVEIHGCRPPDSGIPVIIERKAVEDKGKIEAEQKTWAKS